MMRGRALLKQVSICRIPPSFSHKSNDFLRSQAQINPLHIHRPSQIFAAGAGVNGQGVQSFMPHECSHYCQGFVCVDEIFGKGMAQSMGRQALDARPLPIFGDDTVDARARKRPPLAQVEMRIISVRMLLPFIQPRPQGLVRLQGKRHFSGLASFAKACPHPAAARAQFDVVQSQCRDLRKTQARVQPQANALDRGVRVRICVEAPAESDGRIGYDTITALGVVGQRAKIYTWPQTQRPTTASGKSGALHAKLAVADANHLFISSANLTDYAMHLNMEMGVLIHGGPLPGRVREHFRELIRAGVLVLVK